MNKNIHCITLYIFVFKLHSGWYTGVLVVVLFWKPLHVPLARTLDIPHHNLECVEV